MSKINSITKEINTIIEKKNNEMLEEIKHYLHSLTEKDTIPIVSEIPMEAKTIESLNNLIKLHSLKRAKLLEGTQQYPSTLRNFMLVAKIHSVELFRDIDLKKPEKLVLKSTTGFYPTIKLINWHESDHNLLNDKLEQTIIFQNVNLRPVKILFQESDGEWILHWDGKYKIFSGDDTIGKKH